MNLVNKIEKYLARTKRDVETDIATACALLEQTPYPNTTLIAKARLMKSEYFLGFIESGLEKLLYQEVERAANEANTASKNVEIAELAKSLALPKVEEKFIEVIEKEISDKQVKVTGVVAGAFVENMTKVIPLENKAEFDKQVALKNSLLITKNIELNKLADIAENDNEARKAILEEVGFLNTKIEEVSSRLDSLEAGAIAEPAKEELILTANPDITQQINNIRSQITKTNASIVKYAKSPAKKKRYEDKLVKLTNALNELYEIKADRQ